MQYVGFLACITMSMFNDNSNNNMRLNNPTIQRYILEELKKTGEWIFHKKIVFIISIVVCIYTEKNDPKAMNSNDPKAINFTEKGVTFLCGILTGGSHFYVEK
jgi:uncharacterized protein YdaL